jgi:hypothetical protein
MGPGPPQNPRAHAPAGDLADVDSGVAAILGGVPVVTVGLVDLTVGVLDGLWRVRCAEDLGAVLGERDIYRGGMLAVYGGHAVGVQSAPKPIVGALKALVRVVELAASSAS